MLVLALLLVSAAPPVDVDSADRALAGGAAALGAVAGAVLGSSTALGMGASLAGYNEAARIVPELALAPVFASIGAGAAGAAAGGPASGWAAGIAALTGAGVATLVVALALPQNGNEGSQQRNARFAALVLAPAALAALAAGSAAAVFAESPQTE